MDPSLTRTSDGRVMCCICFEIRWRWELLVDGFGFTWDLCSMGTCAEQAGYDRGAGKFHDDDPYDQEDDQDDEPDN